MRKLSLFIACSLDGYIAGEDGEIDWLFTDQDYGYTPFYATVDTLLMGRRTYEQCLSFGEYPYPGKEAVVVASRALVQADAKVSFVSKSLLAIIEELKQREGNTIWLVGGAQLAHFCRRHDLIDEYVISVHPVLLGKGIPLFRSPLPTHWLELLDCRSFESGLVQMTYGCRR